MEKQTRWVVNEEDTRDEALGVIDSYTGETIADVFLGHRGGECEANAALIAAAPELLEAVRAVQNGFLDGSIKFATPRQTESDPYHKANILICAAMDKLRG